MTEPKKTPETREEIIADFLNRAAMLEARAAEIADTKTQAWVVMNPAGFPLRFEIEPGGKIKGAHLAGFENATSLTQLQALDLAPNVTNGNGEKAIAMTRRAAMLWQAADLRVGAESLKNIKLKD